MNKNNLIIWAVFILCALVAVFVTAFFTFSPKAVNGNKTLRVEIVYSQDDSETIEITTDSLYLRQALEENGLIKGEDSSLGLFVKTVGGVTADEAKQQWWSFTKNGEPLTAGVDMTPVKDGECYEITLTTGY